MSRIGNAIINLPEGVSVNFSDKAVVTVKGAKGELTQQLESGFQLKEEDGSISISRPSEQKRHKALHGLYRALIQNMVVGVSQGYKIELELVGVGFRATTQGQQLEMLIGFSHPVVFVFPPEVKVSAVSEKGKPPMVVLESIDKQLIGQMAAKIRAQRKPEPYKGKGILFKGEQIRRKAGKTAAA